MSLDPDENGLPKPVVLSDDEHVIGIVGNAATGVQSFPVIPDPSSLCNDLEASNFTGNITYARDPSACPTDGTIGIGLDTSQAPAHSKSLPHEPKQPSPEEWKCELCSSLNHKKLRNCAKCQSGTQAKSMVGRRLRTSGGLGTVTTASGKGWVVIETDNGAAHKMRLANVWEFVLCGSGGDLASQSSGTAAALHIPALAVKAKGGPRNWSYAMLNKRVKTKSRGEGFVVEVIEKGWIVVRLDDGGSIKTRPGMVCTIEKDDVVSTFAIKTKAGASREAAAAKHKKRPRSADFFATSSPILDTGIWPNPSLGDRPDVSSDSN